MLGGLCGRGSAHLDRSESEVRVGSRAGQKLSDPIFPEAPQPPKAVLQVGDQVFKHEPTRASYVQVVTVDFWLLVYYQGAHSYLVGDCLCICLLLENLCLLCSACCTHWMK